MNKAILSIAAQIRHEGIRRTVAFWLILIPAILCFWPANATSNPRQIGQAITPIRRAADDQPSTCIQTTTVERWIVTKAGKWIRLGRVVVMDICRP